MKRALNKVSEANAKIFVIQQMMIHDQSFTQAIRNLIVNHAVSAQYAVSIVASKHISLLRSTNDEYMQARTADIIDLSGRVIRILLNLPDVNFFKRKNIVLYKYILTPSEIIELDSDIISAAVSYHGNRHSHSAILARAMNIPGITDINEDIRQFFRKTCCSRRGCGKNNNRTVKKRFLNEAPFIILNLQQGLRFPHSLRLSFLKMIRHQITLRHQKRP